MRLLEDGKGERVLVSGVNREVRRQELRALTPGVDELYDCCVDLGFDGRRHRRQRAGDRRLGRRQGL